MRGKCVSTQWTYELVSYKSLARQCVKMIEIKSSTNFSAVKSTSDVKKVTFLNLGGKSGSGDYMDTQNQAKKVILHGVRGNRIEAKVTPKKSSLAQVKE